MTTRKLGFLFLLGTVRGQQFPTGDDCVPNGFANGLDGVTLDFLTASLSVSFPGAGAFAGSSAVETHNVRRFLVMAAERVHGVAGQQLGRVRADLSALPNPICKLRCG